MTSIIFPGNVISTPWREDRPEIKVTEHDDNNCVRLRPALIIAARRRTTLTYHEAGLAIDNEHFDGGMSQTGRALDLISADCEARDEPSLAVLCVRADTGEVGHGFINPDTVPSGREACYGYWGSR